MSFFVYDIILLILFAIFISAFLYTKRNNLKKEGLLWLYKTSWGIKLIEHVGTKYTKTLAFLSYVCVGLGYILMATMIYLFGKIVYLYVAYPAIVREIKVPPIIPLIPYLPSIFNLDFLPPFYFTYWIAILAVIAITHEFAHGIFAIYNKVKIKTTGFGFFPYFLPVFLAAFVELDEEVMVKKKKIPQMAILSAGTFANVLTAIFFFVILWFFFSFAFTPSGVIFNDYSYNNFSISKISSINGVLLTNPSYEQIVNLVGNQSRNNITVGEDNFIGLKGFSRDKKQMYAYYDSPAINTEIRGAIVSIDGVTINSLDVLTKELAKYSPGEDIELGVKTGEGELETQQFTLGANPLDKNKAWIGIVFHEQEREGIIGAAYDFLSSFKDSNVYYESKYGEFNLFIYNLLWWLILISISVALVNMLPVGIFDGGRFFYLTILGLTKSEKAAKRSFKAMTYLFLFFIVLIMVFWALSFFNIL